MAVDLVRSFKKYRFRDTAVAVLYAPAIFAYLGLNKDEKYDEPTLPKERAYSEKLRLARENNDDLTFNSLMRDNPYKKSAPREWTESIFFAVFAAAFIRMFLIEAYVIPTPSMEGSLLVGDFLFVSKAHYGIRTPMTIAMVPLLHNVIPGLKKESYLKKPQLPYYRLPAIETIDRLEPIVFNWPVGDSVFLTRSRSYSYEQVKAMGDQNRRRYDPELVSQWENKQYRVRPIDKKDHYIKRCVAIPGDSLQVIDGQVFVNGEKQDNPSGVEMRSLVVLPEGMLISDLNKFKFLNRNHKLSNVANFTDVVIGFLTASEIEILKKEVEGINAFPFHKVYVNQQIFEQSGMLDSLNLLKGQFSKFSNEAPSVSELMLDIDQLNILRNSASFEAMVMTNSNQLFPKNTEVSRNWTVDNYGPIYIPKAGTEVVVTPLNINFYSKVISSYEGNKLEIKKGRVYINGVQTTKYKFKQDYFWAMGDNRHNSEDSRVWGFVPEDHIVGKPLFVWFSLKNGKLFDGIRFGRMFKKADRR